MRIITTAGSMFPVGIFIAIILLIRTFKTRRKKLKEVFMRYGNTRSWRVLSIKRMKMGSKNTLKKSTDFFQYTIKLESQGQQILIHLMQNSETPLPVSEGASATGRSAQMNSDVVYFPDLDTWHGVGWFDRPQKYFPPEMLGLN